jgi:hypothetical protein
LLGGLVCLRVSLGISSFGAYLGAALRLPVVTTFLVGVGTAGEVDALVMIAGAVLLYARPERHALGGYLVLVFSLLSLFVSLGGLLVGLILGIIGGTLGITWRPAVAQAGSAFPGAQAPATQGLAKTCPNCGGQAPYETRYCQNCGHSL